MWKYRIISLEYLLLSKLMPNQMPTSPFKAGHTVEVVGVIVISLSAIWKVWVVSHHLSAKVCTRMALVDLSISNWMIGLKSAARM